MSKRKWQDWLTILVAAWTILSPWTFGFAVDRPAQLTFLLLGLLMAGVALYALSGSALAGTEWALVGLGAALIVSPWVLGFAGAARLDAWIVGLVVALLALWSVMNARSRTPPRVMG